MSDYSDNFKWKQLDIIRVTENFGNTQVKKFVFNYSANLQQRLTLNTLYETNTDSETGPKYTFVYNNVMWLPAYGGDYTDHWGIIMVRVAMEQDLHLAA